MWFHQTIYHQHHIYSTKTSLCHTHSLTDIHKRPHSARMIFQIVFVLEINDKSSNSNNNDTSKIVALCINVHKRKRITFDILLAAGRLGQRTRILQDKRLEWPICYKCSIHITSMKPSKYKSDVVMLHTLDDFFSLLCFSRYDRRFVGLMWFSIMMF